MTVGRHQGLTDPLDPTFKLYSPGGIALAAFFGTALAGAFLLFRNHAALGQGRFSRNAIIVGLVFFGVRVGVLAASTVTLGKATTRPAQL